MREVLDFAKEHKGMAVCITISILGYTVALVCGITELILELCNY